MKKRYCTNCGYEDNHHKLICPNCGHIINDIDENIKYLVNDKISNMTGDKILDIILEFIKSHLYGITLTITLIAVIVPNIIINNNMHKDEISTKLVKKIDYKDFDSIVKDILISTYNRENLDKYRYSTYYAVNKNELDDNYDNFIKAYDYVKSLNIDYYLLFNLQIYGDELLHSTKEELFNKYDEVTANDIYDTQRSIYEYAITDESIFNDIEDVKNLYVSFCKCQNKNCNELPWNDIYIEDKIDTFYHFSFVKRNGKWYFLKVAKHEAATMPDDKYLGVVHNGIFKKYNEDDFNKLNNIEFN